MAQAKQVRREQVAVDELREQGYRMLWQVESPGAVVDCWGNGAGKLILLVAYSQHNGWDMFRPVCDTNKVADTLTALAEYTAAPRN